MFTFFIQLIDLLKDHRLGSFFVFFLVSWAVFIAKIIVMNTRKPLQGLNPEKMLGGSVSVIIPIVDEPMDIWKQTLSRLAIALKGINVADVVVVFNGNYSKENVNLALKMGYTTLFEPTASKRRAILLGSEYIKGDITIILDSDTRIGADSVAKLIKVFEDKKVGGATPQHVVQRLNVMRIISNWLEDIRFNEVVRGQSSFGSVSCLPGRMLAIRTPLLKAFAPRLASQTFLGSLCISGDDRYLTSEILNLGFKTVYVEDALVMTEAPDTLGKFAQQRLRWSRTSFRESLRAIDWAPKYPWMAFTNYSMIILRWWFFYVIVTAIMAWIGLIDRDHAINLPFWFMMIGTFIGFFISGTIRQLRHLMKYPEDFRYLPVFLFVTTFILTPIEWWGNLTVRESGWMTRNTK